MLSIISTLHQSISHSYMVFKIYGTKWGLIILWDMMCKRIFKPSSTRWKCKLWALLNGTHSCNCRACWGTFTSRGVIGNLIIAIIYLHLFTTSSSQALFNYCQQKVLGEHFSLKISLTRQVNLVNKSLVREVFIVIFISFSESIRRLCLENLHAIYIYFSVADRCIKAFSVLKLINIDIRLHKHFNCQCSDCQRRTHKKRSESDVDSKFCV